MNERSDKKALFRRLETEIDEILRSSRPYEEVLQAVCDLLKESVPHYDWVGFYFVDPKNGNELVLDPFSGEPTEHVRIKFGEGICGQAAETRNIFVVQDVSKENNYLSCSPEVRSEIVVPIFKDGEIVGELDIDSHRINPFTDEDREFLEKICEMISEVL